MLTNEDHEQCRNESCDNYLEDDDCSLCKSCEAELQKEMVYWHGQFRAGLLDPPATQEEWAEMRRLKR